MFYGFIFFCLFSSPVPSAADTGNTKVLSLEWVDYLEDPQLGHCHQLEVADGVLYLLENRQSRVLKMAWSNPLPPATLFAGHGEGPGELHLPIQSRVGHGILTIKDNRGFSIFQEDGTFLNRFKVFSGHLSFTRIGDQIYMAHANELNHHFIDVYTTNGRKVHTFGEKFLTSLVASRGEHLTTHDEHYFYKGHLLSDGENLFYLNSTLARFKKYSPKGDLLLSRNAVEDFGPVGRFVVDRNKDYLDDLRQVRGSQTTVFECFKHAALFQGQIYLLRIYDYHGFEPALKSQHKALLVFDAQHLTLVNQYHLAVNPDHLVQAFTVDASGRAVLAVDTGETIRIATALLE